MQKHAARGSVACRTSPKSTKDPRTLREERKEGSKEGGAFGKGESRENCSHSNLSHGTTRAFLIL